MILHFRLQARNNAWANDRLLRACEDLQPTEFTALRTGFFPSIALTLNHVHAVDCYYIDALTEGGLGPSAFRSAPTFSKPEALRAAQKALDLRLVEFCDGLSDDDLAREVITDRGESEEAERIDMLLLHLFQHQIHHRGQAHAMFCGTSLRPPQLDEFYLRFDGNVANPEAT